MSGTAPETPIVPALSYTPATEPPRKRQRTGSGTQNLSSSTCNAHSRTPSPGASNSTAMSLLSLSTPSPAFPGQLLPTDDTTSSNATATAGGTPGACLEIDGRQRDDAARGDQGDGFRLPTGTKGGAKGKAREGTPLGPDLGDGDMVWEPAGGAGSIPNEVATRPHASSLGNERQGAVDEDDEPGRDGEYYIDSADCVIRVENTLFRVHRYFLGRDASAFQHMFSMPADGVPPQSIEGFSDQNPVRLYGESVERFRALLSVIYELPLQLQIYNTPSANVERLLTIAEMTNKYHFASIETWAVNALYNVISGLHGPPKPQYELGHCSSLWMKRLLEMALLCGHAPLCNYVAERWVERIVARDLRPVHALEIADRSGNRRLQGYAYYVQLLEMGQDFDPGVVEDGKPYSRSRLASSSAPSSSSAAAADGSHGDEAGRVCGTPATLSREQKQRLLAGHWSLTRLWEELRVNPPKFQRPEGCTYHQHGCLATWTAVWRDVGKSEVTLRVPAVDVLGRLRAMEEQLYMHADLSCALTPQCKRGAVLALKAAMRDVQEGLADRFVDLTADVAVVAQPASADSGVEVGRDDGGIET